MTVGPQDPGQRPVRASRGFLGIVTGSGLAQLLIIAATPLLARLYTPSETAHFMLLISAASILGSFASLKLESAIPVPVAIEESRSLFWLAVLAPLVVLPLVWAVAGVVQLAGMWTETNWNWWDSAAVSIFVVVNGLFVAGGQLAVRLRSYGILSRIPLIQMSGTLATQLSLGAVSYSRGLFVGSLVGRSVGITALMRVCGVHLAQLPPRATARALIRQYWRFPAIFAPASLVQVAGANLPPLMLPALFGYGPAGLFAMAMRVVGVPAAIINSAGQVFLGEFARATSRSDSLRIYLRWSAALLSMAIVISCGIWVLAPLLVPWALGSAWSGTAVLAQYLGVMAGSAILGSPVQHVWTVRQRGFMQFAWNIVRLLCTAGVIWYGAQSGFSLERVTAILAMATTAVYLLAWFGCLWAAARPGPGAPLRAFPG